MSRLAIDEVNRPTTPSSFRQDAIRLLSGSVAAQGLVVLTMPLLAWFFDPEAFGIAALFLSCTLILGVVACGRYELALVLPPDEAEARRLLRACLAIPLGLAILLVPLVWGFGHGLLELGGRAELHPVIGWLPLAVLVHGWFLAFSFWQTREKQYTRQSIAKVSGSVAQVSTSLVGGLMWATTASVLIFGQLIGQGLSLFLIAVPTWRSFRGSPTTEYHWTAMRATLWQYRKFPLVDSWSALMNTLSSNLPVLIMTWFFSPVVVGFYALGQRLLTVPMSLIGRSVAQVFFQRAAVAQHEGKLAPLVKRTVAQLSLLAGFPFLALMIIGPELFTLFFGARWEPAGVYAQILAPWLFLNFLYSPISHLISVLEIQEAGLMLNACLLLTRFGSLVWGGWYQDIHLTLVLYSASGCLVYAIFLFYLTARAGVGASESLRAMIPAQVFGAVLLAPVLVAKLLHTPPVGLFFLASGVGIAYFGSQIPRFRPSWLNRWGSTL